MRHRLTKIAVFLLLGAILNVAVAWGFALTDHKFRHEEHLATEDDTRWWDAHVPEDFPGSPGVVGDNLAFGISTTVMGKPRVLPMKSPPSGVSRWRAGLPVRALEGSLWFDLSKGQPWFIEQHQMEVFDDRLLPLRPIWPGFAINTIFYAAILWLLTLGPFTARRIIRRKRGHCIKCGYDLRGAEHEVCPECGQELCARAKA